MASSFLKKKAEEQAKKIDEQYGQNAYGGSKWREERAKESSGSNAGASSSSSTTKNETNTTTNTNKTSTTTSTNKASSMLQKRAQAQAQKADERDGKDAYGGSKWRETQVARNNAVSNATPVADKSKPNSGYSIDAIRQNLNDSYTNVEAAAKRLSDYAASYNAPAEDWFDQLVTKYGGQQDETGTYIFSDQATLDAFAKERDAAIAEITKAEQEYSALYDEYNNLYSQYNEWNDLAENYKSDASGWEIAGNAFKSGLAQFNDALTGTADWLEQNLITKPLGALLGNDELYKNGIFYGIHDYYSDQKDVYDQELADSLLGKGKVAQIASELGVGATAALPNAALAIMTSGASAAAQGGAALTGAASTGLGTTISNAVTTMAKNPMYWSSFAQTLGPDYEAAINNGATELQASATALISSLLNAGVEVGGGIEVLPARLRGGDINAILAWVKSMPEEGLEEVIQRMVSGSTDKAIYDYDKPFYSATDPNAIINPKEMGKEFGMGAGVAAILGGPQTAVVKTSEAINNRQLGKIGSEYQVAAEDVIAEGLTFSEDSDAYKVATELQAKQEAGKTISDAEIGKQVVANQQAINKEQSIAEANKDPLDTLVELAKETVEEQNKIDLSEDMGQESSTQKASVPYNAMSMENPARQKALIDKQALTKKLGYGEEGMKLFNEIAAETDIDQQELMVRFDTPYQAGLTGLPMEKANLFDNFQTEAYNAGRLDHIARMAKDEQEKPSVIYSEAESGFDFSKAPSDLTQEQKDFGDFMAKAFGVKGEFNGYDGVDYNAKYNKGTGVVAFAQDFGIDSKLMKKLGSMDYQKKVEALSEKRGKSFAFYVAHEIADHVAANRAPAAMRAFNNAMYNYLQSHPTEDSETAREKQTFYRDNKVDLDVHGAIEEVSADNILVLYDGDEQLFMEAMRNVFNGNDTQAKEGAKIYKNKLDEIIQKLKAWLRKLTGKENAEARANVEQGISELEQLRNMFEKAMGEAMTNVKNARAAKQDIATVKEGLGAGAVIQTNKNGELLLAKSKDGSTLVYSIKTYKDGGKDKLREALLRNGHTRTEIDATLAMIDDAADYLTILAAGFAKSHGYTALSDHLVADIITNLKTGKQVMSALVNNGDYPVNIDLALICKKRIAYMNLMTRLIEDGIFDLVNYKGEAIADVNDILRANGFETACLGCFVESRRLQFQAWAETIVSEWNAEVDKRKKNAKNFGFSEGRVKLSDADMDFLSEELKKAGKKNKQGNLNLGQGSAKVRIGRLLDMVPSLQQHLTVADLLTPSGLAALREYDSNIFSIVKSRYGAASPKIVQDFNPYASEIAMMTFKSVSEITSNAVKGAQEYIKQTKKDMGGIKKQPGETDAAFRKRRAEHNAKVENEAMRRYLYDIGGARIQSFSDFMIENVFDYLQITADLAANKFPLHGYTKETICLRLLGMTGAKWNGSLIAHTERSMGKEYAGLLPAEAAKDGSAILVHTEDGDYAIGFDDYARNKATDGQSFIQSIGMKDIIALQLDPRYSKNVGSITIGVSDKQILAMLDSPLFSMVIPYHASGMIPGFARRVGVDMYNDYTDYQNTSVRQLYDANGNAVDSLVDAKGEKIKIDTSFAFNAEIQKTGDARTAANNYIKWCAERHPVYDGKTLVGYATFSPKFSNSPYGTDFSRHPNYYKLLEDFNTYDCITGESAVQGPVEMIFPSESNRLSASEMEAYKQRLRDTGIFSEKEIAKYETIANKTFKELVEDEIKGRADYKVRQDAKWEKTVKEIKDKLMSEYARDNVSSEAKELSDSETQFSLRKKDPPKKTGIAYKVFYAKDGQLYPPMVANPGGAGTPVGVWLDADIGASAAPSKTGRPQVQAGGKGTNASKSSLAFRPGWHLGDLPMATQFARKNPETGVKDLFPADFVWAECEYAMDVDYQEEAMSYGYTENGKFRHSYAGLPRLPEDGYYRYRTNPNPDTVPWVITGAMRVKRILTDAETDKILLDAGVEPMKRQGGPIDLEKLGIEAGEQYSLKTAIGDGPYAPTFYSKMEQVVQNVKQEKLGASSVVSMLKGKGVKDEEIKWSGIEDWLKGKKSVTKQEVLEFIRANDLEIEETELGETIHYSEEQRAELDRLSEENDALWSQVSDNWYALFNSEMPIEIIGSNNMYDRASRKLDARGKGATPEARAIRDALSTIEKNDLAIDAIADEAKAKHGSARWKEYTLEGGENYREYLFKMPDSGYSNRAMKAHWDNNSGVLAHARVQDFDTDDGKMLFVEEIQSDWHNAGHQEGYADGVSEAKLESLKDEIAKARTAVEDAYIAHKDIEGKLVAHITDVDLMAANREAWDTKTEELLAEMRKADDAHKRARAIYVEKSDELTAIVAKGSTPDAPFRKNYHEFVLKRLLRLAAEGDYSSLGWTTGKMQEDRWSSDYAEGYRIEYDQDIPKFLNKYGKQWGAKVEKTTLDGGGDVTYRGPLGTTWNSIREWVDYETDYLGKANGVDYTGRVTVVEVGKELHLTDKETGEVYGVLKVDNGGEEVWSITITDAMRESVLYEGQPQYSLKGEQEMRREIDRIRKEGRKAGKSKAEIESDVMAVVGPEYGQLLKTYGEIKRGEKPYREISVPRLSEEDRKVSQTVRTILEAEATPDAAVPTIQEMITKGDFSYDVYSDKEARVAAEATIRHKGFETALADWLSDVKEGKVSKKSTALGWMLYNNAATDGDLKTAMTVLNSMVQHQRSAAQALQATRILKKMTPDAQLYGIQRSVESLKEELIAKHGDKAPNLEIDEDLAKKFLTAKTDEERAEAEADIYRDIGKQMPSTFADKWNAWRYLAMLGNPRTHVRNFFGNFFFAPVVITKSMTATAIESAVSFVSGGKIDRTKAMPSAKLLQAAWADYANVAEQITAGGKYNDSAMKNQHIQEGREIFKFKPLEKARKGNSALLEVEDMWFAQPHYAFALAQYCKAHGVTVDQLKNGKALGNARDYAIREAQKATYRDTNAFSEAVAKAGRYTGDNKWLRRGSTLVEGVLPFRKTPANILVRGIEYSPIGLANGIKQAVWDVQKGNKTAAEAIDSIATGLTGTGLLALGVYLAAEGLIRGAGGDDEEEKKFEELMGHQAYALELPNGKSITLDWLAPEALPLFIGVNLYELAKENKGQSNLSDIFKAVTSVGEPLLKMSCLQGLNDLLDSNKFAGDLPAVLKMPASAATSYLTQAFPTILGQAERSAQDERMTTYTEKSGFLTSDMQYTLGKISAKVPGWDFNQIPYVDAWGRTESTGSKAGNAFNNFLNPAYTSQIEASAMEEELQRLYDATGEGSVLPSRADKKFTVNKEDKHLTAEEYVEYATEKGQMSYDMLEDLTERNEYANMDDAEKAKAVGLVYEYANAIAKTKVSDYDPTGWVAKAIEAERETGMDEMEYILFKMALEMADGEKETEQKANAISSMSSLSDEEIAFLWGTESASKAYDAGIDMRTYVDLLGDGKSVDVDKLVEAKDAGISIDTYIDYRDTLKSVDQPSESGKYGSYTNKEKAEAISSLNLKDKEIAYFWDTDEGYAALDAGVRMSKYVAFKAAMSDITADKDVNGKTISGSKKNKVIDLLNSMSLTSAEWNWLYGTEYKK